MFYFIILYLLFGLLSIIMEEITSYLFNIINNLYC